MALGRYILFLDDDIYIKDGYIENHIKVLKSQRGAVTVGSLTYDSQFVRRSNATRFFNSRELAQRSFKDGHLLNPFLFGGGICGMRNKDYWVVDGFNSDFRFYGSEDIEFAQRLTDKGLKIIYTKSAKATHFENVSAEKLKNKIFENACNGLVYLDHRYPSLISKSFTLFLVLNLFRTQYSKMITLLQLAVISMIGGVEAPLYALSKSVDGVRWMYCPALYKVLSLCWTCQGVWSANNRKSYFDSRVKYKDFD